MKKTAVWLAVIFMLYIAIGETETAKNAVYSGIMRCINIIIPSLYFMMCVSGIAIKSGIIERISPFFDKASKFFLGMCGEVFLIFLCSMLAGYPVGAKMLNELYVKGQINKRQAEVYLCVCYGAGSAFIFGCVSQCGAKTGKLIIASNIIANVITAFFLGIIFRCHSESERNHLENRIKGSMLISESVSEAGKSMFILCTMIIFFSAVTSAIEPFYSNFVESELKINIIKCLIDISAVTELNIYNYEFLPVVSGLVSFGGICVIMQIRAIMSAEIRIGMFILVRIVTGVLSSFICSIFTVIFIKSGETVNTNAEVCTAKTSASPVASVMLMIMMLVLFLEQEKLKKVQTALKR